MSETRPLQQIAEANVESAKEFDKNRTLMFELVEEIINKNAGIKTDTLKKGQFINLLDDNYIKLSQESREILEENQKAGKDLIIFTLDFLTKNLDLEKAMPKLNKPTSEGGWSMERREEFMEELTDMLDKYVKEYDFSKEDV